MRDDWDRRAREDAQYYVAFGRRKQSREEFFASAADVLRALKDELRRFPPGTDFAKLSALEIGCGPGRLMLPLSEVFGRIAGVDVSGEMIALARENLAAASNAVALQNTGADLSEFANESIDFCYSYAVFQHIPDKEVVWSYLREACRVLKKGGSLLMADSIAPEDDAITNWMNEIELRRDFSHIENRKVSRITEMLTERGFTVLENDYPRIYLRFNEWTARTKVSTEETEALRKEFLEAPAATQEAFQVAPVHDDIAFSWPCWVFRAVKG